jgi:hypothetical protein
MYQRINAFVQQDGGSGQPGHLQPAVVRVRDLDRVDQRPEKTGLQAYPRRIGTAVQCEIGGDREWLLMDGFLETFQSAVPQD